MGGAAEVESGIDVEAAPCEPCEETGVPCRGRTIIRPERIVEGFTCGGGGGGGGDVDDADDASLVLSPET